MSYDIEAGSDWHNYTSSMSQFFKDFDAYPPDWDGMERHAVADKIDAALVNINMNDLATLKSEYDADNGWGSVETAIRFLSGVRASCRAEIPTKVKVSW